MTMFEEYGGCCEKCGQPTKERYIADGVELCGECFKAWIREEPLESLETIMSNGELPQLADLLGVFMARE